MFMLRSTHERIVQEKNIAALNYVDQQKRLVAKLQATIEERNREIASLNRLINDKNADLTKLTRSAALDKLAEIDAPLVADDNPA